jgi:serine protease inhibitor
MNLALREWLNEQTGGQLKDQIDEIAFDPRTVLGLATTVYFRAKWYDEFSETKTEKGVFHGAKNDVTVDFMNTTTNGIGYFWGENFSATVKGLDESGSMYWVLPDENVTTEMLLQDEEVWRFIGSTGTYENGKKMKVNLSVPKFDVSFDADLVENLKNLGLTDCFSYETSDFSPLFEGKAGNKGLMVDELQQGTRVTIDEDGVTGVSYTVVEIFERIEPIYDEIDFVVDRPYIFVITGEDGSVLFIGVVNQL